MPEPNGMEFIKRIKDMNPLVRTILMTAFVIKDELFQDTLKTRFSAKANKIQVCVIGYLVFMKACSTDWGLIDTNRNNIIIIILFVELTYCMSQNELESRYMKKFQRKMSKAGHKDIMKNQEINTSISYNSETERENGSSLKPIALNEISLKAYYKKKKIPS